MSIRVTNFDVRILRKETKDKLFSTEGNSVLDILSSKRLLDLDAEIINADPFLFSYNGKLYLFFERQNRYFGKGIICMIYTEDGVHWSKPVVVLKEDFHLSFPFVFEDNGGVYMIPESGHDKAIRLYRCIDENLQQWKLEKKIVDDGFSWVDSSLIKKDGVYYLFSSYSEKGVYKQHLLSSNQLIGPYKKHPQSPVFVGNDCGRNAGSIISYNQSLYRPVQDCSLGYGDNVSIMEIAEISPDCYREQKVEHHIINTASSFYKRGGHQFSYALFNGEVFVATDAKKWNYNIIETLRKIKNRFIK